jgi:branched-chain amino acid transport system substrate-binding protein
MISKKLVSTSAVLLLIIGLAVGAGGGYYITHSILQSQIKDYSDQIMTLTSDVSNLTSTVSNLNTANLDLQTQISNFENQISGLENQVSGLETQVSDYESQVTTLETQVSSLQSELIEAQNTIEDYEEQLAQIEPRISFYRSILQRYYESNPIQIGITATSEVSRPTVQTVASIAESEINDYCIKGEHPFRFRIVVADNFGSEVKAVDNIVNFSRYGINLVVGHESSAHCTVSLPHISERKMILLSSSANARSLAIVGDNFLRLCPTDLGQIPAMVQTLVSWGIDTVIVIQRGDTWGDGIYDSFKEKFESNGGVIYERIRYEVTAETFVSYLNRAEQSAQKAVGEYGANKVAIQLISTDEAVSIIKVAKNYPTIYDMYWFGTEINSNRITLFDDAPTEADRLKIFSPMIAQEENTEYFEFANKYVTKTGKTPSFYTSAMYDACWLYALSIIETGTTETSKIKPKLFEIAENYRGTSGLCKLDAYGDRYSVDYGIWGYRFKDTQLVEIRYGYYDFDTGLVTWFPNTDITPPG